MIRVRAPSRLHFGLLSLPPAEAPLARSFGSVGLMVETPGLHLTATPATAWSAEGPLAERVLAFARRFVQSLPAEAAHQPQHFVVEQAPPEHAGLGSGTQLGLAVARALALAAGLPELDAVELARRVERGARSAIGVHGFAHGGFLVDGGRGTRNTIAPLVARVAFPEAWRLVLVVPPWGQGLHDHAESLAFHQLAGQPAYPGRADALCRLVLLGMLPALVERDLEAFGEAVYDFNRRVGEVFARAQGGTYASPRVAELVAFVRHQGVRGAGQSSWGPTVFAVAEDADRAEDLARRIRTRFALADAEVFSTRACNSGAAAA